MTAKTIAAIAIAAGTLLTAASAEAGTGGNKMYYNGYGHGGYFHHYDRPYFGIWVGEYEGYGHQCAYYKKKARYTGSHFWWKKYKRCIVRYY